MKLQLVTLTGTKLEQDVYEVILPTVDGEISVFPDHEPLVTLAAPGVIQVRYDKADADDRLELFAVSGGVVEIDGQLVKVLVDEAEHGSDIAEAEGQAALERALKMRDEAADQIELEKAHQLIDRQKVRLKVAELQRHKKRRT